jgi:hypothetical protein
MPVFFILPVFYLFIIRIIDIYYTYYRQVCLYLLTETIDVDFGGGFLTPFVHCLQAVEL